MKFTVNTKPVIESTKLAIINANVSVFHKKSCIVYVSADTNTLKINIEAKSIRTEVTIPGHGEGEPASIFVDSMLFKNLISTFDSDLLEFDFEENALKIISGKSEFSLPKIIDSADISFTSPELPDIANEIKLVKDDWKFISDHQEYAISVSYNTPVYTYAKFTADGKALTGDYDTGIFTKSEQTPFIDCLLTDTVIHLFTELPDDATAYKNDRNIIIQFVQDSYSYRSEITPTYETDEGVGNYNADMILALMNPTDVYSTIDRNRLNKLIDQATILSSNKEDIVTIKANDDKIAITGPNLEGLFDSTHSIVNAYEGKLKLRTFKSAITHFVDDIINIAPLYADDIVNGILLFDSKLYVTIGTIEE